MLNEVLSGLEDPEDSKEAEELTKEKMEEILKAVDEAIKPVREQLTQALAPLIERIEKIENARGVSNKVLENSAVEKGSNDFWEGVF